MKTVRRYLVVSLIVVLSNLADASEPLGKPNIIYVLFDDIGYGQPSSYRTASTFQTPHLDRLAREGMRFTDAHSAAANCTPTRYGVLTGRYPFRIGQFGVLKTFSPPIIPQQRPTVASFLRQHGYHTACIGKWHLGIHWAEEMPGQEDRLPVGTKLTAGPGSVGFDYFYGFTHARNIGSIIEQDTVVANVMPVENQPRMIAQAISYIEQRGCEDRPFFLYFPMCPPHNPIVPAAEFIGKSGLTGKSGRYADWIFQGDHMLGEILQALERSGQADNTLVIATGDNGAAGRPYPPLRAAKSSIYEGGHREPFVTWWPGKIKANTVCQQTICLNDLFATCAEILAVDLPERAAEDSVSILPCLLGQTQQPIHEAVVHQAPGGIAIRQGPWKLIFHRNGNRELFHLQDDLGETHNAAAEQPHIVRRLTQLMQSYIDRGRSTPGPTQKNEFEMSLTFNGKQAPKAKRRAAKKDQSADSLAP